MLTFHRSTNCVWFLTHSCEALIDQHNLCGSSWLGIPSYRLTLFLRCSSQNCAFPRIHFRCHARCGAMLMLGCLASGSTGSPHRDRVNWVIHSEAIIKPVWRGIWRPQSGKIGDTPGGCNRANLEMHLEAVIELGCEWARLWLSKAVIDKVWRCTCRPWSSEIGGVFGGSRSGGGGWGGRHDGSWDCIHWLTRNSGNVVHWVQHGLRRDWVGAGDSRCCVDAVCRVCSTQCFLYSVYAVLGVTSWSWHGVIESDDLGLCS